jgi:zinc protease
MRELGPDPRAGSVPGPHDIVRHELDNGIMILVRENHASPSVVIDGLLGAGAVDTPPDKAGLTSFAAAALLRGAGRRTFSQIFEEIESVGARLAFSAGQHSTEFGGRCLAEDLDLILDIAWDALRTPIFPAEQLERLRGQIITGLHIQAHDTRQVAALEFAKLAYQPEHPYSRSTTGTIETVASITREDILDFHQGYYGPRGMILSIVGDVRAETLIPRLERRLGGWSGLDQAVRPELPAVRPLTAPQERFVFVPGKSQADIILGAAGPPRAADDFMHARLANTILGVFGLMGRLGASVRDGRGLAYYAYSELRGGLGPGPWLVSAGVHPENVSQAIGTIRDEIRRLQSEPVPADELADNQSFMLGSLPIHLETNEGVSNIMLDMELFGLGMDYLQRYPEMIMKIGADHVQAAAQKYLDPDVYALVVAGPVAEKDHE